MAKKTTKKETLEAQIEKQVEILENSNDKIESTEINTTLETIANSINAVDTELENDSVEKIKEMAKDFTEMLAPINELSEEIDEKTSNKATFEEQILKSNSKENLEEVISKEIETTKELIAKAEKINNGTNTKTGFASVTNWWNGMGYDF